MTSKLVHSWCVFALATICQLWGQPGPLRGSARQEQPGPLRGSARQEQPGPLRGSARQEVKAPKLLIAFASVRERRDPPYPKIYFYEHDGIAKGKIVGAIDSPGAGVNKTRSDMHPTLSAMAAIPASPRSSGSPMGPASTSTIARRRSCWRTRHPRVAQSA